MSRGPGKGVDPEVWSRASEALGEEGDVETLLELAGRGRAALKAVAAVLEEPRALRVRKDLAERGGEGLDAASPPIKLLRRASGREASARTRKNPIVRNEAFHCLHCDFDVPPLDRGERNHCPRCLRSRHVDGPVPGDRASDCGGLMVAEQLEVSGGVSRVTHRCERCGFTRRNRLFPDRQPEPDRLELLLPSQPGEPGGA